MADAAKHAAIGAVAGAGAYLLFCWMTDRRVTFPVLLASSAAGSAFALLPDLLEPATDPNHRQFFHSMTMLGLVGYGNYRALGDPSLDPDRKLAIFVTSAGFASHLLLDSGTPKSLPLI